MRYTGAEMAFDAAWNSGYTAARFGDPITANPWSIALHKREYLAWRSGYLSYTA
jgi:hypothetical protein